MFGWLRRKEVQTKVFDSNSSAFDFACENLKYPLLVEAVIPALVLEVGKPGQEGERWYLLRIAAPEGGREVWGCTLKEAEAFPTVGDFIGFRIVRIASELPDYMNVIGYIAMKLEPVLVDGKMWQMAENYTPTNIKPTVRW
ncbi:hypothetical protein OR1_01779 [Geobacter sp. OR-1]|uniref:hypothetical protein n=1 Tax=Geobacter sp. OR-1 TaxID=1266765 RepID=UPI0005432A13|nr:hypothetical protein [Geobacter sp. OR-1]GAM09500.1 hypothetical protein OR1_01779 [Geobacter sp. OR-1]